MEWNGMICKYESGHSLSAIAHELCFAISAGDTIVKDVAYLKGHMKGATVMIVKKCEGILSDMENS